ncbi:MAG: DedA family protein [Leptospiraceae bacterium]|nr:DedA family protein [Leptospiraceae bacterium]
MKDFFGVAFATFLSEDLTCIGSGILLRTNRLDPYSAFLGSTLGIFIGDLILFIIGFFFHKSFSHFEFYQKIISLSIINKIQTGLKENFAYAIFISRFTPGLRLPTYLLTGILRLSFIRFTLYTFIASFLWTPILVAVSYFYGELIIDYLQNNKFFYPILFTFTFLGAVVYRITLKLMKGESRRELFLTISKIPRFEFWNSTLVYIPVAFYLIYLAIRLKGIRYFTTANPAIENGGGLALESKFKILSNLNKEFTVKSILLDKESLDEKILLIKKFMTENELEFPIILKPDMGERGLSIKLVSSNDSLIQTLGEINFPFLVQEFHPGPNEVGIFYYRFPKNDKGDILSINKKIFPKITGDGKNTLRELVRLHPRFRFQEKSFFENNQSIFDFILEKDKEYTLGFSGNHFQGCMFIDGANLITPTLIKTIDEIAKEFSGFYFGRFDIRYVSDEDLKQGKNFKIIELNGSSSESTNIYDPNFTVLQAYGYLFKQWKILWTVGKQCVELGFSKPMAYQEFFSLLKKHREYKKNLDPYAKKN